MTTRAQSEAIFPKRLKQARKRAGFSQEKLGVLAEIDEATASARMNQYERGIHFPDVQLIGRIAKQLKVPVSFLLEPDDTLAQIILIYGELRSPAKKQALRLLQEFKEQPQ
jgi:transcriptional regulator with XRE-family HTH domain